MAGIFSQGGSAGHRYAGWLSEVEAKNFQFGGKVFNGSPSAIYVGSNLVWKNWLLPATKQAIRGAFGVDGTAVIQATNAYLNQLAAQGQAGKDKATALAGFINQHPLDAALYGGLYVQDGLVFQMDRAYECTAAKWTDFIGGVEFNGTNVQIVDDVPYFNNAAWYKLNDTLAYDRTACTIEAYVAMEGYTNSWGCVFFTNSGNALIMAINGVAAYNMNLTTEWYIGSLPTGSISLNKDRAYLNKSALGAGGQGPLIGGAADTRIGARSDGNSCFKGKIYGIRIYNRLLTEAEILANQDIDLKRFTPSTP